MLFRCLFRRRYPVTGLHVAILTFICRHERNGTDLKQHMSTRVGKKGGEKDRVKFMTAQVICTEHLCPTLSHIL
jgi:hypothetical protein